MLSKKTYLTIAIVLFVVFAACKNKSGKVNLENVDTENINYDLAETIKLEEKEPIELKGSSIIDTAWYVPLETTEQNILGSVDKILTSGEMIFILDRTTQSINIFNSKGQFFKRIANKGRGPQEYSVIRDFTLDISEKKIVIYDDFLSKLFFFDFDGGYIGSREVPFIFNHLAVLGKQYIYYTGNSPNKDKVYIEDYFLLREKQDNSIELAVKNLKYDISLKAQDQFHFSGNHLSLALPVVDNTIYKITHNKTIPVYTIDFGKNVIDRELLKNKKFREDIIQPLNDRKLPIFSGTHLMTEKFLYFRYVENGEFTAVFYNRANGEFIKWRNFISDDQYSLFSITPTYANYNEDIFLTVLNSNTFTKGKPFINRPALNKTKQLKILAENIQPIDNPVLFFYKVKGLGTGFSKD